MPLYDDKKRDPALADFPLQLLTPHSRYPFHLMGDDEGSSLRDIREHRVLHSDGHYYLTARLSREDAEARGIKDDDLIRLWNHRGSVVCAAQVTDRLRPGIVSAPTASASIARGEPGKSHRPRRLREPAEHQQGDREEDPRHPAQHHADPGREVDRRRHLAPAESGVMARSGTCSSTSSAATTAASASSPSRTSTTATTSRATPRRSRRRATSGSTSSARSAAAIRSSTRTSCRRCATTATTRPA
jgi:hypothetical protein